MLTGIYFQNIAIQAFREKNSIEKKSGNTKGNGAFIVPRYDPAVERKNGRSKWLNVTSEPKAS